MNILLSLSECHKYHFQLLNVMEPVGVTANIVERLGIFIPAAKVPSPCFFSKYQTKSDLYRNINKPERLKVLLTTAGTFGQRHPTPSTLSRNYQRNNFDTVFFFIVLPNQAEINA